MESCLCFTTFTHANQWRLFSRLFNLNMEIVNHLAKHVGINDVGQKHDYIIHYHIFFIFILHLMKMCIK
jgi:hypothetical protein